MPKRDVRAERAARIEALLAKARAGEQPFGMHLSVNSPISIEIGNRLDIVDFYVYNMEHTLTTTADLQRMAPILDMTEKPWLVKVNWADPLLIRDVQDAGAYGVLVPFVDTPEELMELREICSFPNRGICLIARALGYGSSSLPTVDWWNDYCPSKYEKFINEDFLYVPMIESATAVENLDALVAMDGFPMVSVGWVDLNQSMHDQGFTMEEIGKVQQVVVATAREAGKLVLGPIPGRLGVPVNDETLLINREKVQAEISKYDLCYADDTVMLAHGALLNAQLINGKRDIIW